MAKIKTNARKQRGATKTRCRKHRPVRSEADALVLFNQWTRLPYFMYRRLLNSKTLGYPLSQLDEEDTIQDGNAALWKASLYWDPRKSKFSTYACNAIQYEYFNLVNKRIRRGDHMKLQSEFRDTGYVPRSDLADADLMRHLERLIDGLGPEMASIFRKHMFEGMPLKLIEREFGAGWKYVKRLLVEAQRRLSRYAPEFGFCGTEITHNDDTALDDFTSPKYMCEQRWSCERCGVRGAVVAMRCAARQTILRMAIVRHRIAVPECEATSDQIVLGWPVEAK